jgi:hypothetical protein
VLVDTNAGVAARDEEGITNTPLLPPLLLDTGVAPKGIQNAVPADAPELLPLDEVAPPEEELLLEDELLEELLELLELPEDDELLDEPEPLELEDEGALEPLLEEPPPHPVSTAASNKLPRSAVLEALALRHVRGLAALGRLFRESGTTAVDMVRAPV